MYPEGFYVKSIFVIGEFIRYILLEWDREVGSASLTSRVKEAPCQGRRIAKAGIFFWPVQCKCGTGGPQKRVAREEDRR